MIDRGTTLWFLTLPAVVIRAPGVLRIYLTPYIEQVAGVLEANRYRDRRRVKRELRKFHKRLFSS
jgi:hypothetical protein